jgi:hypothetical protein
MEDDEMGETCSTHKEVRDAYTFLVENPERKETTWETYR